MRAFIALLVVVQTAIATDVSPKWLVPDQVLFADDFSQQRGESKID
jgi:hypothetical protein